jgi:hypothetical protein
MMQAIASILYNIVNVDHTSLNCTVEYKRKALSSAMVVMRPLSVAVAMIEESMHSEATSFTDYADMARLPDRIRDILARGLGTIEFTTKEREKEIEVEEVALAVDDEGSIEEDMNMQIVFESLDRGSEVSNLAVPAPKRKRVRNHISKELPAAVALEGLFSSSDFLAHEMERRNGKVDGMEEGTVQSQGLGSSTLSVNSEIQQGAPGMTDTEKEDAEKGTDYQAASACLLTDDVSGDREEESKKSGAPTAPASAPASVSVSGLLPADGSIPIGGSDVAHTEGNINASHPKVDATVVNLDIDLSKATLAAFTWQNDPVTMRSSRNRRHKFRVAIRDEIPKILKSFLADEVITEEEIIDQYSTHIHHLEKCLHAEASSRLVYSDRGTLKDRLHDLLHRMDDYIQLKELE